MPKFHDDALKQRVQDLERQLEQAPEDQDVSDLLQQLDQARQENQAAFDRNRDAWTSQRGQGRKGQQGQT